ncbi:Transmembrane 9 superfamily member 7 [Porphyridium purpureum]|uniref:Transmembrane 9 superfamily member n=1 Tax=Porphyridium purpureum TaxID=35688 RepID=A0A5J4Z8T8_PORPP|nr:Transmembrane 9 superfamily member 7 [Porphyridium purpureum]|eukprot:POR7236..scf295_1
MRTGAMDPPGKLRCGVVVWAVVVTLAIVLVNSAHAFYLPGIAPIDYEAGFKLEVFANRLTSPVNKVPFNYYSLPFCQPEKRPKSKHRNLGQILSGEMVSPTQFQIAMLVEEKCKLLCDKPTVLDEKMTKRLISRIKDSYSVRLNMDNMPVVMEHTIVGKDGEQSAYSLGYRLGAEKDGKFFLFNHLAFKVLYHVPSHVTQSFLASGNKPVYRVVGFHVVPASVAHNADKPCEFTRDQLLQEVKVGAKVFTTYSVSFEESPIRWATRWDPLLKASDEQRGVLWFSIINSIFMGLFLTAMVAFIILRTIYQDFVRYNRLEEDDEIQDDSGWKLVHGDVFRPPVHKEALSVMVGSGAQLLFVTSTVLVFAALGFLSPANRGGLLSAMLYSWVFSSAICGYMAARTYAMLQGSSNKHVTLASALLFPGVAFALMICLNLFMTIKRSTSAIPFLTLVFLTFLWFGLSVPMNVLGAYLGFRGKPVEFPTRTNHIPREIPPPPFGIAYKYYALLSGLIPYGVVFVELAFILNSFWRSQIYYMFGLLFVVLVLLIVTCAEVGIVFVYMSLSSENYHWWWNAFGCCASSGVYVYLYSIVFLFQTVGVAKLGSHVVSTITYLAYMTLVSFAFSLMCGFVGFQSSLIFVRRIFAAVRVD